MVNREWEGTKPMSPAQIDLGDELAAVLRELDEPLEKSARELIVLELYRRATISEGKAAELLGLSRLDFIRYAAQLGIPYFRMTRRGARRRVGEASGAVIASSVVSNSSPLIALTQIGQLELLRHLEFDSVDSICCRT